MPREELPKINQCVHFVLDIFAAFHPYPCWQHYVDLLEIKEHMK